MKISQDRMRKSFDLYKGVLCSQCLDRFDQVVAPFKKLNYEWEDIEDLKARHKIKLMYKIGLWQKSLCEDCLHSLLQQAKKKDDPQELHGLAKDFHDKGVRR